MTCRKSWGKAGNGPLLQQDSYSQKDLLKAESCIVQLPKSCDGSCFHQKLWFLHVSSGMFYFENIEKWCFSSIPQRLRVVVLQLVSSRLNARGCLDRSMDPLWHVFSQQKLVCFGITGIQTSDQNSSKSIWKKLPDRFCLRPKLLKWADLGHPKLLKLSRAAREVPGKQTWSHPDLSPRNIHNVASIWSSAERCSGTSGTSPHTSDTEDSARK